MARCGFTSTNGQSLQQERHETALKAALVAQVQQARDAGAGYEALAAMVSKFESTQ